MPQPILIPLRKVVQLEEVLAATDAKRILVADCYVAAAEQWTPRPWGWETIRDGRTVINIDHHAAAERFYRNVSSGNLAIEYAAHNKFDPAAAVVINHTDCDSVISSAILCGLLESAPRYGEAVIAADHTGEPNPLADLLQALDATRDYGTSLRNLRLLESGQPIEPHAEAELKDRFRERALAAQLVNDGAFERFGKIAVATLPGENRVSGEFLPALLPGAWIIVSGSPMKNGLWETKIRLGLAAPAGYSLFSMGVNRAEPLFGGRWNAGSTKRAGGSPVPPREVALRLFKYLEPAAS
jgi:hypothetical protein